MVDGETGLLGDPESIGEIAIEMVMLYNDSCFVKLDGSKAESGF